jgi:hypothetical protein
MAKSSSKSLMIWLELTLDGSIMNVAKCNMKIGYCTKKILMGTLFATGKRVGRDLGGI